MVYVVSRTAVIVQTFPFCVPEDIVAFIISASKVTVIINATPVGISSPSVLITFLTLKLPVAFEEEYAFLNEAAVAVATVPATTVTSTSSVSDAVVSSV